MDRGLGNFFIFHLKSLDALVPSQSKTFKAANFKFSPGRFSGRSVAIN